MKCRYANDNSEVIFEDGSYLTAEILPIIESFT